MTAQELLNHYDSGQCWPQSLDADGQYSVSDAYKDALSIRSLRIARNEKPKGYKIGFTNRKIWDLYKVYSPIWGTVWDSTVFYGNGHEASISLKNICQPRIEPEIIFCFKHTPKQNASLDDLYNSIEWLAPGFEIVQSHRPNWKFTASETIADSGLHARLCIGQKYPIQDIANSAGELLKILSSSSAQLYLDNMLVETGLGSSVLDSPLEALHYFVKELRTCPESTDIQPGDVVTTGTWTDAWPLLPGQSWTVKFGFLDTNFNLKLLD